jgi:chromosome segregation protein
MKGFKSFASATTLRFEPGITAVVGPNGSGKSNVVDAIAWVLGEQGAKALRGGKMEDVIFAGTTGRPPLGRAEVSLTIDNSDGALPIDYAEVSITRRMFRDGASDYEINGDSARLLDIQELLSDSGIGREMHVIVGQGQLDNVLQARPEDRRGFIEEAAGVLKHRKRKEKALRKLDGLQANLTRLGDLTAELRRQLKPLGRQAELAQRAAGVQAELRDTRLRLLADDLHTQQARLATEIADETASSNRRSELDEQLRLASGTESGLEASLADAAPMLAEANRVHSNLTALAERLRGTQQVARERIRQLSDNGADHRPARDPDDLDAEAAAAQADELALADELELARADLAGVLADRQAAEQALAASEKQLLSAARAAADRREGLATLTGRVNALRARATAAVDEIARIVITAEQARTRAAAAEHDLAEAETQAGGLDSDALGLDASHEAALDGLQAITAAHQALSNEIGQAEREMSTLAARADALALGIAARDGASAVLAASELDGVLGPAAARLSIEPEHRRAVAAALAAATDAVVVTSTLAAQRVLEHLRAADAGRVGLLIADNADSHQLPETTPPAAAEYQSSPLQPGEYWAIRLVHAPGLQTSLARLLAGVVVVGDLAAAQRLLARHPELRAVTADGDLLGSDWSVGGSPSSPGAIEIQAELDDARSRLSALAESTERHRRELAELEQQRVTATADVQDTLAALNASDARFSAVAERLAEIGQVARAAAAEANRLDDARIAAEQARDTDLAGLADLEERLRLAEAEPVDELPGTADRDRHGEAVAAARNAELEARLAVRTREERARALAGRADQLRNAADAERAARAARHAEQRRRERARWIAEAVAQAAADTIEQLGLALTRSAADRDAVAAGTEQGSRELADVRSTLRQLRSGLETLTSAAHRDELARAEQKLRIEQLETRAADEFGIAATDLVAQYGIDQPMPPSNAELAEFASVRDRGETVTMPQPSTFDRAVLTKRAAAAERDLAQLGKVNPLALEEFAALEERHQFLSTQLEDLKNTRRDLLTVVKEVDDKILAVFAAAYADVAAEFEIVFSSLFPGGEGRLYLTDPDDLLLTGIEIEARPPGKKVKRLSLLSGGERSLTAVALLVAIFRARPSPFYIMDEVEAALDEVNLRRLVGLIDELRSSSQIIIITHQKTTMEIADALYGVTMRGDGISQVISQRLREPGDISNART